MSEPDQDIQFLREAYHRTRQLLDDLTRQRAELDASPSRLEPSRLQAGRLALQHAVDSAVRMLESIETELKSRGDCN